MQWLDRIVEHPKRFAIIDNGDGTYTLDPRPGNIVQEGTPVNAVNMNSIENRIESHLLNYVPHGGFDFNTELTYDIDGNLTQIDEKEGAALKTRTTLGYDVDGNLETVNVKKYAPNGTDVELEFTDTLTYDVDGNLEKVEREVV